jgi:hypothetical protein
MAGIEANLFVAAANGALFAFEELQKRAAIIEEKLRDIAPAIIADGALENLLDLVPRCFAPALAPVKQLKDGHEIIMTAAHALIPEKETATALVVAVAERRGRRSPFLARLALGFDF